MLVQNFSITFGLFVTRNKWKATYSPIVEDDIYNGETYDVRLEKEG
jgi:hypothetical protein